MLTLAVFLGAVVALSSACCTPDQWEGGEAAVVGFSGGFHDKNGMVKEFNRVSYDYTNKRTHVSLYYVYDGKPHEYKMLTRYDDKQNPEEGKLYVVDVKEKKCHTKTLSKPFRQSCTPKEAKYTGNFTIGLAGAGGLHADGYEIEGEGYSVNLAVSMIKGGACIPLGEAVAAKKGRMSTLSDITFVNITPGIKDASIFDVPKECDKVTEGELVEEMIRDQYFMAL